MRACAAGTASPEKDIIEMAWILVAVAGLLEVAWALGLKASAGFTRPLPSALTKRRDKPRHFRPRKDSADAEGVL